MKKVGGPEGNENERISCQRKTGQALNENRNGIKNKKLEGEADGLGAWTPSGEKGGEKTSLSRNPGVGVFPYFRGRRRGLWSFLRGEKSKVVGLIREGEGALGGEGTALFTTA